jgi:hypothetical protein
MNDLQWRIGVLEESRSYTITNGDKHDMTKKLLDGDYILVRIDAADGFEVYGREVEVELGAGAGAPC